MILLRSIATVGGLTMISRVLGFVRDIMIAAILGAGPLADVFFVAFRFPNLFRRLFAEGAFNAAFVPLFAASLEENGKHEARLFADEALNMLLWTLVFFVAVMEIAMPWAMYVIAPGFASDPGKFDLAVELSRITFPYLIFISMVSLMAGVLNSLSRFAAAAATPILLNICLIGAILWLTPLMPGPAHSLAWGIAGAGLVQLVWMSVNCARAGMTPRLGMPRLTPRVKKLARRILPVAVGAGIYQVNLLIDTVIASLLPAGSISYLFFADRVNQLPLGVVGVAVGTALLPLLSRQLRAGKNGEAMDSQNRAIEFALVLTLPAAVALMVLAEPVIVTLFQRGEFGSSQAAATATALAVYATGLPAYVLVKTLAPGFFAREDTLTPVKVAAFAMIANLILNLVLMGPFLHIGIAMATSVSAWLNAVTLAMILRRRGHLEVDARLRHRLPRIIMASAGMGIALMAGMKFAAALLAGGQLERAAGLAVLVVGGLVSFAVLAHLFGAARLADMRSLMRR